MEKKPLQIQLEAAQKTIDVLKKKVKQLQNSEFQSSIHKQLNHIRQRETENRKKQELAELRSEELKKYNAVLEASVAERTREIKLLLDNSGEGYIPIDRQGIVGKAYSQAVSIFFSRDPSGSHISELFEQKKDQWNHYLTLLFEERLPFQYLVTLCPKTVEIGSRVLALSYRPVRNEKGRLDQLLIIAKDVTEIIKLESKSEEERDRNKALVKIISSKGKLVNILTMLRTLKLELPEEKEGKRALHTIKAGFGLLECAPLVKLCHSWEDKLKENFSNDRFLEAVSTVLNATEDFIKKNKNVLGEIEKESESVTVALSDLQKLFERGKKLQAPREILTEIEKLGQMRPEKVFSFLSDSLILVAERLGKEVDPIEWLPSVEIMPELYKELFSVLVDIPRNIISHGIEEPKQRRILGKNVKGHVLAQLVKREDGFYALSFQDDGIGIDYQAVRDKAQLLGLPVPQTEGDVHMLLMTTELSTKATATDLSGRGIGLFAIYSEAQKMGGTVKLESKAGKGCRITITFRQKEL